MAYRQAKATALAAAGTLAAPGCAHAAQMTSVENAIDGIFGAITDSALYPVLGWLVRILPLIAAIALVASIIMAVCSSRSRGTYVAAAVVALVVLACSSYVPGIMDEAVSKGGSSIPSIDWDKASASSGGSGSAAGDGAEDSSSDASSRGSSQKGRPGVIVDDPTSTE